MSGAGQARRDYDIAASQNAQENFERVAKALEALIERRNQDVSAAMADYLADGVSEDYAAKELRWKTAASNVQGIIQTLRTAMSRNDDVAMRTLGRARSAVSGIG